MAIERAELRFVLNEVILAILENSLIIESANGNHTFSFRLGVLVCVLHLFLTVFHMARADWLNLLMQRTTQNILGVFHVHTRAAALAVGAVVLIGNGRSISISWIFAIALIFKVICIFFVC